MLHSCVIAKLITLCWWPDSGVREQQEKGFPPSLYSYIKLVEIDASRGEILNRLKLKLMLRNNWVEMENRVVVLILWRLQIQYN